MSYYISLNEIVSDALDEANKSVKDFDKWRLFGCRAVANIEQNFAANPKSVRLPVNPNQTVTLPADYVSWSKIGIINNAGEVSSLRINNGLSIYADTLSNRIAKLTPNVTDQFNNLTGSPYYYNYFYNGQYQVLYGTGGGLIQYGDCKVDEANNVIILGEQFQYPDIILEYLSAPERDEELQVPPIYREAIIAFIHWKAKLGTERAYYVRCIEARRGLNNKKATLQTINEVIRQTGGMYLKA